MAHSSYCSIGMAHLFVTVPGEGGWRQVDPTLDAGFSLSQCRVHFNRSECPKRVNDSLISADSGGRCSVLVPLRVEKA